MVFSEVKRVLKKEGTLWLNLGDSYSSHKDCKSVPQTLAVGGGREQACVIDKGRSVSRDTKMLKSVGLKNKDIVGIPWRVAFALQKDGWYLRQDIIWHKPNPMPESVTDRCTKSHEYIFLLAQSASYYYDAEAIKEPVVRLWDDSNGGNLSPCVNHKANGKIRERGGSYPKCDGFRNKRDVWSESTKPFKEAHFATFPEGLVEPMIKAGCPVGGTVLDPFSGAGTTCLVAKKLNRNYIGIELNQRYIEMAEKRIETDCGTLLQ